MPISIYNYCFSKIPDIIKLYNNTFLSTKDDYYLDADWQGGPSITVNFLTEEEEKSVYKYIKDYVNNEWPIDLSEKEIDKTRRKYEKAQRQLILTENRKSQNLKMHNHGDVIIREKKFDVYNSSLHYKQNTSYRFRLNSIYLEMLEKYQHLNEKEKMHLFLKMYIKITEQYDEGPKYGYLSFLSHIQGFFSNIPTNKTKEKVLGEFKTLFNKYFDDLNNIEVPKTILNEYRAWEKEIISISREIKSSFSYEKYSGSGFIEMNDQFDKFVENISSLDNKYHKSVMEIQNLKEFILSPEMITYRDLVNLFYLCLPLFEISMKKKQFLAFSTVMYYEKILKKDEIEYRFEI